MPDIIKKGALKRKTSSGTEILHPNTEADIVEYSNSESGLSATNVQDAIDEIVSGGVGVTSVKIGDSTTKSGAVVFSLAEIGAQQKITDGSATPASVSDGVITFKGVSQSNGAIGTGSAISGATTYTKAQEDTLLGGKVSGPASSTNNAIVRFDGTTGKVIKASKATIDDDGQIYTPKGIEFVSHDCWIYEPSQGVLGVMGRGLELWGAQGNIKLYANSFDYAYKFPTTAITEDKIIATTDQIPTLPSGSAKVADTAAIGTSTTDKIVTLYGVTQTNGAISDGLSITGAKVYNTSKIDTEVTRLDNRIDAVEGRGRYLSGWDCTTGKPVTDPSTLPYTYKTGDYFIVSVVGTTNKKPSGSSYTGAASTTTAEANVAVGDTYTYDGASAQTDKWVLTHTVVNNQRVQVGTGTGSVSFGDNTVVKFLSGSNVSIVGNSSGETITISATDTTYGADRGISLVSGKFGHSNSAITPVTTNSFKKVAYDTYGHITSSTDVSKSDLTGLGVADDSLVVHKGTSSSPSNETIYGEKNFFGNVKISATFESRTLTSTIYQSSYPLVISPSNNLLDINGSVFPDEHNTYDLGLDTSSWKDAYINGYLADGALSSSTTHKVKISEITSHIGSTSNPHSVTKAQVGLGNVTNESKETMFTSPTFTGNVTLPTSVKIGSLTSTGFVKYTNGTLSVANPVTSITAGTGLTGGTITSTGTIALATSGVTAGTYSACAVDVYGRVTSGGQVLEVISSGATPSVVNGGWYFEENAA